MLTCWIWASLVYTTAHVGLKTAENRNIYQILKSGSSCVHPCPIRVKFGMTGWTHGLLYYTKYYPDHYTLSLMQGKKR